jgi:hypothetical protein
MPSTQVHVHVYKTVMDVVGGQVGVFFLVN